MDALAGLVESGEVIGNLFPISDRAVVARIEAEYSTGRKDLPEGFGPPLRTC